MCLKPYVVKYAGATVSQELVFAKTAKQASCLVEEILFTDPSLKICAVRPAPKAERFAEDTEPHIVKNLEAIYQAGMIHPGRKSDFCIQCRRFEFLEFPKSMLWRVNVFMYCRECRPPRVATLPLAGAQSGVQLISMPVEDSLSPERGQEPRSKWIYVELKETNKGWSVYLKTKSGSIYLESFQSEKLAQRIIRFWYFTGHLHHLSGLQAPKQSAQNQSLCKSCGCRVTWLTTEKGSSMPINGWVRSSDGMYRSGMDTHWNLCPNAKEWKSGS